MSDTPTVAPESRRVLILTPIGNDAKLAARVLSEAKIASEICGDVTELCQAARTSFGVVLIAEEALNAAGMEAMETWLSEEPPWSDPPIVFLSSRLSSAPPQQRLRVFKHSGNVTVLERPLHGLTLVSSIQVALRARLRQYEVKHLLEQRDIALENIKQAEQQLKAMNQVLEERVEERTAVAEKKNQQLRKLASELTEIEQRERRRLAHILHDSLQQMLVAAKLRVGTLRSRCTETETREALEQIDHLLAGSIDESRSLTVELSPPILYEGGLCSALHWLGRKMEKDHRLLIHLDCDEDLEPPGDDVKAFLFQAVREFLLNVVKHAGVAEAVVDLRRFGPNQAELRVSDSGAGFDQAQQPSQEQSFGLFSIRERLESYGGELQIKSAPALGTEVSLLFPIASPQQLPPVSEETGDRQRPAPSEEANPFDDVSAIRVLLADDHQMVRAGLATLLDEEPDILIVGEASNGLMAVEMAQKDQPDVIVMDVSMPHLNGIEATRQIHREAPHIKIIGLSMHEEDDMAKAMRAAGAVSYITKGAASETLVSTIRSCCGQEKTASASA